MSKEPVLLHLPKGKAAEVLTGKDERLAKSFSQLPTDEQDEFLRPIVQSIKAYRRALKTLMEGRMAGYRDIVWPHLSRPCQVMIFGSPDGIVVRQDLPLPGEEPLGIFVSWVDKPLSEVLPLVSERALHKEGTKFAPTDGLRLRMVRKADPNAGEPEEVVKEWLLTLETSLEGALDPDTVRRSRLAFALNEVGLGWSIVPQGSAQPLLDQEFVVRLPVGWETIEVIRPTEVPPVQWTDAEAESFADRDILQSVAIKHLDLRHGQSVDVLKVARERSEALIAEFAAALTGHEEQIQRFLKAHPALISPLLQRVWPKLPLGQSLVTDFVIKEPLDDYLFVELERADHPLFRADGQQTQEVTHAINQIVDWFRFIQDNREFLIREHGLAGLSPTPRGLVVIGRSTGLTDANKRKLKILGESTPRIQIVTYDDLFERARAVFANLFSHLKPTSPR